VPDHDLTLSDLQDRVRERAAAYLTIHSEVESPAALAAAIGLIPDRQWAEGDPRGRLRRPAPNSVVEYESGLSEEHSPTDHAAALVARLRPYCERIRALTAAEGTWGVVDIVEHAGFATEWFANTEAWVEPEDLHALAEMGVALRFDAYVAAPDEA